MTTENWYTYYVRVSIDNTEHFERFLTDSSVEHIRISIDVNAGTSLYSIVMSTEDALSLKLSFPLIGILNFTKTLTVKEEDNA